MYTRVTLNKGYNNNIAELCVSIFKHHTKEKKKIVL